MTEPIPPKTLDEQKADFTAEGAPPAAPAVVAVPVNRIGREEFGARFRALFADPAFRSEDASITRLEAIAWEEYTAGRKVRFPE